MSLDHALLQGTDSSLVITWSEPSGDGRAPGGGIPSIAHWGARLEQFDPAMVSRPVPRASLDVDPVLGIVAEEADGFSGRPGIGGHRPDGSGWSPRFTLGAEPELQPGSARFRLTDEVAELDLELAVAISAYDVVTVDATLTNTGTTPYVLERLAPSLPVPPQATELLTFAGRWCLEFQPQRQPFVGRTSVENRRGRTSHDRLPAVVCGTSGFGEQAGELWSAQLSWSGNFEVSAEQVADGRRHLQAGALLAPGEIVLDSGQTFAAPTVVGAWSSDGLSGLSSRHHRHLRSQPHWPSSPRPVLLNTWEAVYFDHDLDTLRRLADTAAEVGVERFVLDDGWFGGRRDDTAGLGDWWVSPDVWPDGLGPLVDHVTSRGMEFGLWFEPEMVNADSDLYRAHPEWTLTTNGHEPVEGRQQLVLDLGRSDVRQHLFAQIDAVLSEYDIAYVKWDMNRDVVQGSGADGRAGIHRFVLGTYELLDQLRAAHPGVEFESCSSGGGRADLGILTRTERIWTSDCNDAIDRQRIQRGFSMLFPPEVMGAHLGPGVAHTTGRHQPVSFRLATALFGHLGVEWNLLNASDEELAEVRAGIELHKRLRPLLHHGRVIRADHPDPAALVHGVVADDASHGVFAYVQLGSSLSTVPPQLRIPGLDPGRTYEVQVVDDIASARHFGRTDPAWLGGLAISGAQLAAAGLSVPVLFPQSVLLIELTAA